MYLSDAYQRHPAKAPETGSIAIALSWLPLDAHTAHSHAHLHYLHTTPHTHTQTYRTCAYSFLRGVTGGIDSTFYAAGRLWAAVAGSPDSDQHETLLGKRTFAGRSLKAR